MLLAALWDAGADPTAVRSAVRAVVPADVVFRHEVRDGFQVARAQVVPDAADTASGPDRRWADIRRALATAPLTAQVRDRSTAVFAALAQAEATVHGTDVDRVHFHEVGAHDSIGDVVGVVAALEQLGVTRVVCTPVGVGGGEDAAGTLGHGRVPAPVPAVLHLAAAAGAPVLAGPGSGETCTPTGMALLVTLADAWGPLPPLRPSALGAGAGTRETPGRFGALRVVLGAPVGPLGDTGTDVALLTSTNVDDLDPRLWPRVLARLLEVGAQDAWLAPILMKKGRPAHTLHVLSDPERAQAVRDVVVHETSAIGMRVRRWPSTRSPATRSRCTSTVTGCASSGPGSTAGSSTRSRSGRTSPPRPHGPVRRPSRSSPGPRRSPSSSRPEPGRRAGPPPRRPGPPRLPSRVDPVPTLGS
jgi:uncharacterized protein (TIGR00299 family) protein